MITIESTKNKITTWITLLKSDPESTVLFRTAALAVLSLLIISYAGCSLFVDPNQKKLDKKIAELKELKLTYPELADDSIFSVVPKLDERIKTLQDQLTTDTLKEKVLWEQSRAMSDPEQFNRIVFTLGPSAPVKIGSKLKKMDNQATRKLGSFNLFPMAIEGEADFIDLLSYITYLERSQEIGFMDELIIEKKAAKNGKDNFRNQLVHFSLLVGRLELEGLYD